MTPAARWPRPVLAATVAALAVVLALLGIYRGEALWSTSDGVYAMTARELLHGRGLYDQIAAAQPPLMYLLGAGLLALSDSLTMLRAGLELCVLATGVLTATAVLRLTGRTRWAVAAALAVPFTPIALHENALLTPETLGAPLLLAMALLAADERRAGAAGAVGAVCLAIKLSFALPVLAIALVVPWRRRVLTWLIGAGALLAATGTAVWGGALWATW